MATAVATESPIKGTKYITMEGCSSVMEYIAMRSVQLAVQDMKKAIKTVRSSLKNIRKGVSVEANQSILEAETKKIEEIKDFFYNDPSMILEDLGIDGVDFYATVLRFIDRDLPIENVVLELPYTVIEGKNGQLTFQFK